MSSVIGINRLSSNTNSFRSNGSAPLESNAELGSKVSQPDPGQSKHMVEDEDVDSGDENVHMENDSDDDLFLGPPPALDDDDDDDDFEDERQIKNFMEDSDSPNVQSDIVDGEGSPGIRRVYRNEDDDEDDDDDDAISRTEASANSEEVASARTGGRNKRKNFKPRNIVYNAENEANEVSMNNNNNNLNNNINDEEDDNSEDSSTCLPLNLSAGSEVSMVGRKSLLPRRLDMTSSPIDLSVQNPGFSESEPRGRNLSVVRPEILFGELGNKYSASDLFPHLPLPPMMVRQSLAALVAAQSSSDRLTASESMQEALQEVLKLYGVPTELAEAILKNASNVTPEKLSSPPASSSLTDSPTSSTSASFAPGMLSAALQGSTLSPSAGGHPPTPPRTPKSGGPDMQQSRYPLGLKLPSTQTPSTSMSGTSMHPSVPPMLSLAAIQDQVNKTSPNILAAHLNKPMMHPGLSASLSSSLGIPHPPPPSLAGLGIPPHILAAQRVGMMPGKASSTDYTRYFKRFGSCLECSSFYCKDMNYREHFHCTVLMCKDKVFAKKEEMIRHSKWHQKMEEAFKYGFRRVTPSDDCSDHFQDCQHNKKQTHYHCVQSEGCDKVYISTSDVQMHFNYHRKDNAIQREGFLRFRGQEDCNTSYCPFRDQKTTHFHCNRGGCNFTFKNKADMEKHKNFHMKDEQLNKDGFKKIMKNDECGYDECRFSKTVNHIHCIRDNCDYVLHSSGQLYSHKRKHDRKDSEGPYSKKFKLAQSMMLTDGFHHVDERPPSSSGSMASGSSTPPLHPQNHMGKDPFLQSLMAHNPHAMSSMLPPHMKPHHPMFGMQFPPQFGSQQMLLSELIRDKVPDDAWQNYMLHFDNSEGCGFQGCAIEDLEHFHCKDDGCETVFRKGDEYREHGRNHFIQDHISELFFIKSDPDDYENECPDHCSYKNSQLHFHCKWENCADVVLSSDPPFKRLDHYKLHEYTRKWNMTGKEPVSMTLTNSIDAMFKRKRGRPPKNRVVEVWNENFPSPMNNHDMHGSPQAVFTSFKLPKPGPGGHHDMGMPMPGSPFGLGNRFPLPMSCFPTSTSPSNAINAVSRVMSAPLGGLPAVASQMAARQIPSHRGASHSSQTHSPDRISVDEDSCRSSSPKSTPNTPKSSSFAQKSSEGEPRTESSGSNSDDSPPKSQGLIKARGTYYPLTAFPTSMPQGPVMHRDDSPPRTELSTTEEVSPTISLKSKLGLNFMVSFTRQENENPLAKLLQANQELMSPGSTHRALKADIDEDRLLNVSTHPLFGPEPEEESCGRPFCKLKRRAHYHCNLCNQGFTEKDKLEQHLKRHASQEIPDRMSTSPIPHVTNNGNLASLLKDNNYSGDLRGGDGKDSSFSKSNHESNKSSSPATSVSSPRPSPPILAPSSPLSSAGGSSPFQGLPPGFPGSPFGMVRYPPISVATPVSLSASLAVQNPLLLSHGMSPFLPGSMLLPGMGHHFPRFPGDAQSMAAAMAKLQSPNSMFESMKSLSHLPDPSNLKRSSPMGGLLDEDSADHKKLRLQSSMRMLKDEPVPEGYMRFRFNEDCSFSCCNYREHQTHFHCMRKDCNYRFCDKTRFVQHTARHERLDTLCGNEFEGFRGVTCSRESCEFNIANMKVPLSGDPQKSSSHFHCLKCDYYCTDTNKVVAHRRQHQKLDSINAAGFEKYTPTQFCLVSGCGHNGKQTHYHCSKCQYAVLGLSQMEAHKFRHANE